MWYGRGRSRNSSRYASMYPEYVPVAERKARAAKQVEKLAKKRGAPLSPIELEGRTIAKTFWGKAWCDNVESYQDFAYRLDRGRSYVRSGAVIDLQIQRGKVSALVTGSGRSPYEISIEIAPLEKKRWEAIKKACTNKIDSLLSLAQGKLPETVLHRFCDKQEGLFPTPKEINLKCNCPDIAGLCKHLAAVLYGIGARLDQDPKLFFLLRGVKETELIGGQAIDVLTAGVETTIADGDLADVFGVEFDTEIEVKPKPAKGVKKDKTIIKKVVAKKKTVRKTRVSETKQISRKVAAKKKLKRITKSVNS